MLPPHLALPGSNLSLIETVILTISTSVAHMEREDVSGPRLASLAEEGGCEISAMEVVPDDYALIEDRLQHYINEGVRFIFTTGGTGLAKSDVTPEATLSVIEREAPGFAEALRVASAKHTPLGMLTRGVAGVAGQTLIVNFPGSPKAVEQLFAVVTPTLPHVGDLLEGNTAHDESDDGA